MNVQQAKQQHLRDILTRMGFAPERKVRGEYWYCSPFRPDEHEASFKLSRDGQAWFDHGRGEGGNIFDLVGGYYNISDFRMQLAKVRYLVEGQLRHYQLRRRDRVDERCLPHQKIQMLVVSRVFESKL